MSVIRMSFTVRPIGTVKVSEGRIRLVIFPEYCDALLNVDKFSHIIVLWWISGRDNQEDRATLVVTPRGGKIPEVSGVFACRSPSRPNPIGHSIVQVLDVDMNTCTITIDQIDAFEGSPIIDIKPYLPSSDRVADARVAPWFSDLAKRYDT